MHSNILRALLYIGLQGSTPVKFIDQGGHDIHMVKGKSTRECSLKFVCLFPHLINYTIKTLNDPIKIDQINLMAIIYRQIRGIP